MPDYSKGLIYKITTANGLYVGSCCNLKKREKSHRERIHNDKNKSHNMVVYQNIRENNGVWKMEKIKDFPCNSRRELEKEETKIMLELNADLNMIRPYVTEEEQNENKKEIMKKYYNENKDRILEQKREYEKKNKNRISAVKREKITCECGCEITRGEIARHRKSKKHLRLMENIKI